MARLSAMPAGTRGRLLAMILLLVAVGGVYFLVATLFSTSTPGARPAKTASMWAHRFCFRGCRLHPAVDAKQFGDAIRRLESGAGQHHHGRLIHAYGALAQ